MLCIAPVWCILSTHTHDLSKQYRLFENVASTGFYKSPPLKQQYFVYNYDLYLLKVNTK